MKTETLMSVEGDLGIETPCFLFRNVVTTATPVNGENRSIRIKPPLDDVKIRSFDGNWGLVEVEQRNGPRATLRMHRMHLNALGLPNDIVIEKIETVEKKSDVIWKRPRLKARLLFVLAGGLVIVGAAIAMKNKR